MPYVYCTLSNNQEFVNWQKKDAKEMPARRNTININGMVNVINKALITPRGAVTKVTDEELKELEANDSFKRQMKGGFISVSDKEEDPEKVAKEDMTPRDKSAQLEAKDFTGDDPKPIVNADEKKKAQNKKK